MRKLTPHFRKKLQYYRDRGKYKPYMEYVVTIPAEIVNNPNFPLKRGKVKIKINGRRLIINQ